MPSSKRTCTTKYEDPIQTLPQKQNSPQSNEDLVGPITNSIQKGDASKSEPVFTRYGRPVRNPVRGVSEDDTDSNSDNGNDDDFHDTKTIRTKQQKITSTTEEEDPYKDQEVFYCPYKGCEFHEPNRCALINDHILKYHDPDILALKPASEQIFIYVCERSGQIIHFDESSCDTLNNDDKLNVQVISNEGQKNETKKKTGKQRYYCPYKNCNITLSRACSLYRHIRVKHYKGLGVMVSGYNVQQVFQTSRGEILDFENENICNMLEPGEPICHQHIVSGKEFISTLLYCPYNKCSSPAFLSQKSLYQHIQKCHDPNLAIPDNLSLEYVFKHPDTGETRKFSDGKRKRMKYRININE
ncbi:hypothetical protein BDA99DRAFT_105122 [Phascolomyces articulosus]|uniref:C2H2-type domain-containing protein n=1 Tax=Phascolomyces articulosus TaxID=60185 RepID=A0AAD5PEA4_9FUNG|nr:hypothetical protein BDA99DRAFT_105122 [Phascolomyces articulosus]